MKPPTNPLPVYTPTAIPNAAYGALSVPQSPSQPSYVIVQQAAPELSWLRQHGGQLIAAGGAGVLVLAGLLAVAVVAVAVSVGAISCALGWLVIKSLMGPQQTKK
ncbi:hypothetical protein [Streptomyces sp. NPDC059828]|uniref:hypothetical protein n=1 Tax=Streptomyces sp. NPDC059828 TaxID=3346965 RepID=UPI00364664C3